MPRRLYYCDHHVFELPPGHRFPVQKYALLRAALEAAGEFELAASPLAGAADVELAHDPAYVQAFLDGSIDPRLMRRIGLPWSEGLVRRTLASVGGTIAAAREALATGFGGTLAGGTHHAFRGEGSGFCVFNDIAVTIRKLGLRAAIVDLDVHQGDGTASIFLGDPSVLTLSLHGENNFPFHKQQSSIDIGLPDGTGDEEYLARLADALPRVVEFAPEIVFYQSGVDALSEDRLGRLRLTHAGLIARDRQVFDLALRHRLPLVVTMGGGYADPIGLTVQAHANTFHEAFRHFPQPR